MSYIYVNAAGGGIANRLNSLINGIGLHLLTKKKLVYFWNDKHYTCHCKFDDIYLVKPNDIFELREEVDISSSKYLLLVDYPPEAYPQGSVQPWDTVYFRDMLHDDIIHFVKNIPEDCDIIIRTPNLYTFGTPITEIIRLFHSVVDFQPAFKKFILDFISTHNLDVGVHMRMTDKIIVNRYDINNFENDLVFIRNTYPGAYFFICSDEPEYEKKALNFLPKSFNYPKQTKIEKKIENMPLTFQKEGEQYNTFENFIRNKEYSIDGFRDLYLLGCCNTIIGINHWGSTYFEMAKIFNKSNIRFLFGV